MTKSELIKNLAKLHKGLYQKDVSKLVDLVFEELVAALERGDRVELRGFGAFSVRKRSSRVARNPRTNKAVSLGERVVPYFRAGKNLRARINGEKLESASAK